MSRAQFLYELQQTDLEIDKTNGGLRRVEEALADTAKLDSARQAREGIGEELGQARSRLKSIEWEVEDQTKRLSSLDYKLYSGEVKNPKELSSMQREVEHLREMKRSTEDRELDLLEEVEGRESELRTAENEVKSLEDEWRSKEAELRREKGDLEAKLADLESKRGKQVAGIEPEDLGRYEKLRATKRGQAVALVEREVCQGCRVSIPLNTIKEARTGKGLVTCGSCGRIIYVPR